MSEQGHGLVSEGQHPLFGDQPPSGTWAADGSAGVSDEDRLTGFLHDELCCDTRPCGRWNNPSSGHRQYYRDKACSLIARLEPEIGIANVFTAVRVFADELM